MRQIDDHNPQINAIVSLKDRNDLLHESQNCDVLLAEKRQEASRGDGYFGSDEYHRDWLLGIPMAVKDMANVAGLPTTMGGSPLIISEDPETDDLANAKESDAFVQRLVDAGAIIIGKTNAPEQGLGSHTFNTYFGATRNSLNHDWSAGGSSGGAAAAVASMMLAVADGSDMMGSLRNPAAWNAPPLYSLRPTAGIMEEQVVGHQNDPTLSDDGNPLSYPISTIGPIARTVNDMVMLFQTMAPSHSKLHNIRDILDAPTSPPINTKKPKIAWLGDWNGKLPVEVGIIDQCSEAIDRTLIGVLDIDRITEQNLFFDIEKLWNSWITIRSSVLYRKMSQDYEWQALMSSSIRNELKWELERGRQLGHQDLSAALDIASEWSSFVSKQIFQEYDAFALPSCQSYPFSVEWTFPTKINGTAMDTYHRWMEIMVPVSLAGLPCVTIPIGLDPQGRPMGISIAGPRGSDRELMKIAKSCEKEITSRE